MKMKMKRGEMIGFQGYLSYDYHPEDQTLSVNEKEAEIVRYIFERYVQGAGDRKIANLGRKTKKGFTTWQESTVIPISKRRLDNHGEEDQYYIKDHLDPIVSTEMFDKAEEIRLRRSWSKNTVEKNDGKREKYSRKFAFSSLLKCVYCGSSLSRRSWHGGTQYNKII
ncbi:recombinase family protein [Cytobacillus solani]|uniref:recombinase family protein n=1 Tax=Cytobacillus solani TaxID=1637975 RepID=UPI0006F22569|nr:recombinase family protein [Cytobacillus solani]USK57119.1 recombinase family protein [Cytobacillus solani]